MTTQPTGFSFCFRNHSTDSDATHDRVHDRVWLVKRDSLWWLRFCPPFYGMEILMVDDTHDTLQLYCLVLELQGFSVQVADSGEEALRVVRDTVKAFDAILLDVEIPRMNGWEVLRAIRQLPQGQKSYIAMFSAYGKTEENAALAQQLGADSFLEKPVLPQALIDAIRVGVAQKRSQK